ncbi:MAG TPA: hypothetical protein VFP68_21115 [Burkholderiaceae bacterium]|nr:hypothetical protein [Burkholderiaceae bacterium]
MQMHSGRRLRVLRDGALRRIPGPIALATLLAACAAGPPPPDWQANAKSAIDRSVSAWLMGDTRVEAQEFERAREQVGRTGRPELVARVELMRCAARTATLSFGPCPGFERLRADASPAESAYADYLAGKPLSREGIERLPPAQRPVAQSLAGPDMRVPSVQTIDDPLSRLIAIAVLFQAGRADPFIIEQAVETASNEGWRRPLMAWLEVQALRAERAGDVAEAQRLRRRIDLVQAARGEGGR